VFDSLRRPTSGLLYKAIMTANTATRPAAMPLALTSAAAATGVPVSVGKIRLALPVRVGGWKNVDLPCSGPWDVEVAVLV